MTDVAAAERCVRRKVAADQVRRARPGRGDTHTEFACELGIGRGHESRHLFVPSLDKFDLAVGPIERAEHAVDAVPGIAEDPPHAPSMQALDEVVADGHRHGSSSLQPRQHQSPCDAGLSLVLTLSRRRRFRAAAE